MPLAVPQTADDLQETLLNPANATELFNNGAPTREFGELVSGYVKAQLDEKSGIAEQVRTQVDATAATYFRNAAAQGVIPRQGMVPNAERIMTGAGQQVASRYAAGYNPKAPGAKLDAKFGGDSGLRDYLKAIYHGNMSERLFDDERAEIRTVQNSFGSTVPADGGFLIPERLRADLLRVSLETAIVRSRARVIPMETLTVPYPTIDSTSNASSVYGGIVGYWTEESGQLTVSQARFGRVMLTARKLTAYTEVPNELFSDSIISLEAFINEAFPEALAWFEDLAFINGTGVGQPLGFMRADAAVSASAESGQATQTILWENIVNMYKRMLPGSLARAVWICNIDTFSELATMALSVGTGGAPVWINSGVGGPPATILGRPVILTEKVPTLGTAGDINFVDLGYYLVGDRQQIQATTSPHFKFQNDQTAMRFIERVDGQPWLQSAITPNQGANTLTPFVKLATR